jgi:SAM-dependent methyltransferase
MSAASYSAVTELPGGRATAEQLSMLRTRYHLARERSRGKDVLEVACGSGMGLGYLAKEARTVVGGDVDESVLRFAREHYRGCGNIEVRQMDAHELPFEDDSFDLVLMYEALYYLRDAGQFLKEAQRVLRPGGELIICSVNCRWHGFNPSPFSTRYVAPDEIGALMEQSGFSPRIEFGFVDRGQSLKRQAISLVRRAAVRAHLVPKTMRGKEWLKRLFYGPLKSLDGELTDDIAPLAELHELTPDVATSDFKVFYAIGASRKQSAQRRKAA